MPHAAALLLGCVLLVRGAIIPPRTDEPHYPGAVVREDNTQQDLREDRPDVP